MTTVAEIRAASTPIRSLQPESRERGAAGCGPSLRLAHWIELSLLVGCDEKGWLEKTWTKNPRLSLVEDPAHPLLPFRLAGRLETTNAAEQRNPTSVPANGQWKVITLRRAEASIGLSRLSRS